MWWTRHKTVIAVAAMVVLAGLVAGVLLVLRDGGKARLAWVTPTPSHAAKQLGSPFTGGRVRSLHRVLAVKIDNIAYARPQTGLTHADIVYVLPVEGGLSRFLAIFSADYPPVIGPVRSAREDDRECFARSGLPGLASSAPTAPRLPYIHRTPRTWT